jgi:hypothetical protein
MKVKYSYKMWWGRPVIPALWRQRQEDLEVKASLNYSEFQASLDYTARLCLKNI